MPKNTYRGVSPYFSNTRPPYKHQKNSLLHLVTQKSLKTTAKDLAASAQLRAALIGDQEISSLNYSIDVINGIVYLSGVAANEKERERVITHAQSLRFAKKVINYIILSTDKRD